MIYTNFVRVIVAVVVLSLFLSCGVNSVIRSIILNDQEEIKLGNNLKAQILADTVNYPRYTRSAEVIKYIDSVGKVIAKAQNDRDTLPFTFTVIGADTVINAFSIPGGHVFVYTGLLKSASNGAEVAGVIAHEVAHITKYHGADRLATGSVVNLVNQILFGDSSSVVGAAAQIVEGLAFLKLSRDDEYQADSCAVAYTTAASINPRGMASFLDFLLQKYGSAGIFEPLSDHPDTKERIAKVDTVITHTPNVPLDTAKSFTSEYLTIKSKI